MLERDVQRKVRDYAHKLGWRTFKWAGVNQRGVPDCIFINPEGFVLFIEFKAKGKKPTKLQALKIKQLRDNNAEVFIIDNVETGKFTVDLYNEVEA